ncbi:hypothetical protein GSI_04619 [Ganoderma sinense ZZ0214-1]|uniref:Uncharacterized protein n=1 Tax=Ganoderma sinense ZZ0214-1 TaxID=1077348 RepID=A0A2G8SHC8_9APHY|nr:hypothetical protein GSI_04619 [Ganoderma sinense ZZ0214-1]
MATSIDTPRFSDLASSLPITDRASLVGLSDHNVRVLSAAKADEYRKFALALLSIYNAVAPIHRLPFEVLSTIFEMCWMNRRSFCIGHVCRQWRCVLLDTPAFWASAVEGEPFRLQDPSNGYLQAMLERSIPQAITPLFRNFFQDMSPCLALHADRVVSLAVILGDHPELAELWSCLNAGMRSLKTLAISLFNDPWWALGTPTPDEILRLSPTTLPRLARVTAPGSFLKYFTIPSLRHITLQNAAVQHAYNHRLPSDEYLRNALAVCALNLESLALRNVSPPGGYEDAPLSLPTLHKLVIEDTARPCAVMLSRLVLPDTTHIQASIDGCTSLCAAVPPSAPAIQSALSATDTVAILGISNTNTIALHCCSGTTNFQTSLLTAALHAPEPRRALAPDDLVRFFRHKPGVANVVLGELDSRDVPAVDLRAFPALRRIVAGGSMAHHVLRELARTVTVRVTDSSESESESDDEIQTGELGGDPRPGDEVQVRAICPELDMLNLDFEFKLCVERREDGSVQVPQPAVTQMDSETRGAVVDAHFRALCAELERVLPLRAKTGAKPLRLELGCPDWRQWWLAGSEGGQMWAADLEANTAELELEPWGPIVERLEKLVDGPVMFNGY